MRTIRESSTSEKQRRTELGENSKSIICHLLREKTWRYVQREITKPEIARNCRDEKRRNAIHVSSFIPFIPFSPRIFFCI